MNVSRTLAVATTLVVLAGCSGLSPEDRATLNDTRAMAQDAKNEAAQAAAAAQKAEQSAAESAAAAQAASKKADRVFRQSGMK